MRIALIAPILLAGCGGTPDDDDVPAVNLASNGVPMIERPDARPNAQGPGTLMGLTQMQVEQAQLVNAAGTRMGEIEKVELDPRGNIRALRIDLDDSIAMGRVIRIGLNGLTVVRGDPWNLRTDATAAQLAAQPPVIS